MIWKGTFKRSSSWKCISEQKPSYELKETACRAQRQDWIKTRSGEYYENILLYWRFKI